MFSAKIISSIIHPSWSTNNRNQQIPLKITFKKEKKTHIEQKILCGNLQDPEEQQRANSAARGNL
jgi:hypothetical protein